MRQLFILLAAFFISFNVYSQTAEVFCESASKKLDKNDTYGALKDFNDAITYYPDYAPAYYGRGILLFGIASYDAAIRDFTKVIDLSYTTEDFGSALLMRGLSYYGLKKYDKCCEDLRSAKDLGEPKAAEAISRCCR